MSETGENLAPLENPLSTSVQRVSAAMEPTIADLTLLQRIGSGAYGEVWLARTTLGTLRAVKIVRRAEFDDDRPYEREFAGIRKFEPISRSHEGFVDLLQVGRNDAEGYFYYVMELADDAGAKRNDGVMENWSIGQTPRTQHSSTPTLQDPNSYTPRTLAAEVKSRGALPLDECVRVARTLASALAELHRHGLVHRDIKPSNIIFVDGVPKLADIGLVALANEARSFVGTEGFIPPEGPGDPQADLYSLGIVLYVMSTGKSHRDFPEPPTDLASRPDRERWLELQAIIYRACQADPRQRYSSAEALLDDLERLIKGGSVRRLHAWQRSLNHVKKAALAVGAIAVVAAIVYSLALRAPRSSSFKRSPVPEAEEEYKMGMNDLHANLNAKAAIKHFERATQLDPKFADAFAQLADAWFSIPGETNVRKGQEAAETAVKLDPQSGLAHMFLAASKTYNLDFSAAAEENRLAVRLSPDTEEVLQTSALNWAILGRTNEALVNLQKAIDVGRNIPSKLRVIYSGFVYGWCRKYDDAIKLYDANPWLKDDVDSPHFVQAQCYLAKGDYTNAMRLTRQSALERGKDSEEQVNAEFNALETAYRQGGPEGYWQRRLELESSKTGGRHWMNLAAIHAHLNEPNKAIECLQRAKQLTPLDFATEIYTDSSFDTLRRDSQSVKELIDELWHKK